MMDLKLHVAGFLHYCRMNREVYYGIDLGEKYTMVSFFDIGMKEPETVSTVAGSENFQIATFVAKKKGIGQWYYGDEAREQVSAGNAIGVDRLYARALANEDIWLDGENYTCRELLALFLKKVIKLPGKLYILGQTGAVGIAVPSVDSNVLDMFESLPRLLELPREKVFLMEQRESFYYYALNQDQSLWLNDVAVFDYQNNKLSYAILNRNRNTTPQLVTFTEGFPGALIDDKDVQFSEIVKSALGTKVLSCIYLIGDGFDGDWMRESLQTVCKGRRAFLGKNLYSRGASYAAMVKTTAVDWPFVYMGDHELKINLSLKVFSGGKLEFLTLLTAGRSWYDCTGECEVILDGTPEVEVWLQRPDSRTPQVEALQLVDLPKRPPKTTRLRISAIATSDRTIHVEVKDLGFGEIFKSKGLSWDYDLIME